MTPQPDRSADPPQRFPSKVAVLLRDDLLSWQRLNVTAFLVSAIAGTDAELMGEPYRDADDVSYLPMLRQPVLIYQGDAALVRTVHQRALHRELALSIFTAELFATGNDADNRAAVAAVGTDALDLGGVGVHGPRNAVDRTLKGARMHP